MEEKMETMRVWSLDPALPGPLGRSALSSREVGVAAASPSEREGASSRFNRS